MTLQKAIKIKENHRHLHPDENYQELLEAENLSIEALKWRALMEKDYASWCGPLLPGETSE